MALLYLPGMNLALNRFFTKGRMQHIELALSNSNPNLLSMNLTSDQPYWLLRNGLRFDYPKLDRDLRCECVVIGAGITGALIADCLAKSGREIVVVDKRNVGTGSTSASTSLLQYEIDVPLIELREQIGKEKADRAYRASYHSIDLIESIAKSLSVPVGFDRRSSLYVANDKETREKLRQEAQARRELGMDIEYCDQAELKSEFGVEGLAALISSQAATCDPYRFAGELLRRVVNNGGKVYAHTLIKKFDCSSSQIVLSTEHGPQITAKHVIVANGYESQAMLKEKIVDLANTYALISEPLDADDWQKEWMLWEMKDPYLYLRISSDHRLLAGGEDDPYHDPEMRDQAITCKAEKIRKKVQQLIPALQFTTEHAWAGTFGKTKDGLAYIGPSPEYPGCLFVLGFGGNGTMFSAGATEIIPLMLNKKFHPNADLYRFGR
jgi:glycine/D-amino acid oxidase-like deaminating enzyme